MELTVACIHSQSQAHGSYSFSLESSLFVSSSGVRRWLTSVKIRLQIWIQHLYSMASFIALINSKDEILRMHYSGIT